MKGLTGPQNDVLLAARRVAMLHEKYMPKIGLMNPDEIREAATKMDRAIKELIEAVNKEKDFDERSKN